MAAANSRAMPRGRERAIPMDHTSTYADESCSVEEFLPLTQRLLNIEESLAGLNSTLLETLARLTGDYEAEVVSSGDVRSSSIENTLYRIESALREARHTSQLVINRV